MSVFAPFYLIGRKTSSKTSVLSVSSCIQGLLLKDWDSVTHSNIAEVKLTQLVMLFRVAPHYDSLMSGEQIFYLCTIIVRYFHMINFHCALVTQSLGPYKVLNQKQITQTLL